jgi:hypothetical protein
MRTEQVFYAATKIVAASCAGGRGEGMHESPVLVSKAVDLAVLLVAEVEKRATAERVAYEAERQVADAAQRAIAVQIGNEVDLPPPHLLEQVATAVAASSPPPAVAAAIKAPPVAAAVDPTPEQVPPPPPPPPAPAPTKRSR